MSDDCMSRLLAEPFNLSQHDLLRVDVDSLILRGKGLGDAVGKDLHRTKGIEITAKGFVHGARTHALLR